MAGSGRAAKVTARQQLGRVLRTVWERAGCGQPAATLPPVRKIAVIYNARSGALASDSGTPAERVNDLFARRGISTELKEFEPATVGDDVRALLGHAPDAVIVAGGDGTIRSVAERLVQTDVPLGVLPAGTMNVLARDLGIPTELEAAADALVGAPVQRIDVASVNGKPFLCSSALAMMPHLGRVRERARGQSAWPLLRLVVRAIRIVRRYPRMRLRIVVDGYERTVRTSAIVVSNNPLSTQPAPKLGRERLDSGQLVAYATRDRTRWDLVAIGAKLMDGTWQNDRRVRTYEGATVEVHSSKLRLTSVMSDGETDQLTMPLRYEIQPRALAVLAPKPDA